MSRRMMILAIPAAAFAVGACMALLTGPTWASLTARTRLMSATSGTVGGMVSTADVGIISSSNLGAAGSPNSWRAMMALRPRPPRFMIPTTRIPNWPTYAPYYPFGGGSSGGSGGNEYSTLDLEDFGFDGMRASRHWMTKPYDAGNLGPRWRHGVPQLFLDTANNEIQMVIGSSPWVTWDLSGLVPKFGHTERLVQYDANTYVFYDNNGNEMVFASFNHPNGLLRGKIIDAQSAMLLNGGWTFIYDGNTNLTFIEQSHTAQARKTQFAITHVPMFGGWRATSCAQKHFNDSGVSELIRTASYEYYDGIEIGGPAGYLKRVTITDPTANVIERKYYRYTSAGMLSYAVEGPAYERLKADPLVGSDAFVLTAADGTVHKYALGWTYDGFQRVIGQTDPAVCDPVVSGFTFEYLGSPWPDDPGLNVWNTRTTRTWPDGITKEISYVDRAGLLMLHIRRDASSDVWREQYVYDSLGRVYLTATTALIMGYDENFPSLVTGWNPSGLLRGTDYASTTTATTSVAGDVAGFVTRRYVANGGDALQSTQERYTYIRHDATGWISNSIYPISARTVYEDAAGSVARTVTTTYTFQNGTGSNQIGTKTVASPAVSTANNGTGSATSTIQHYDRWLHPTWYRDADLFIDFNQWDNLSGGKTQRVTDVNAAIVPGSPWTTPPGGGLNLTENFLTDSLARTTKHTDASNQVTWTVYKDANWETRTYRGWTGSLPTGPTLVKRGDKPGSYLEELTTSIAPAVNGTDPTGTETISQATLVGNTNWFSSTRTYTDTGDRMSKTDSYFKLAALAYTPAASMGVQGTNYLRESLSYDRNGNDERRVDWTGTIHRTVWNNVHRPLSMWVGTNDTPGTGTWSPSNNTTPSNMKQTDGFEYDSNGLGNGNLTKSRSYVTATTSLDTLLEYDYRDRQSKVTQPDGVATRWTLDNLSQVTLLETLDNTGIVRSKTQTIFDECGQLCRRSVFIDPSTSLLNSLTENFWYNGRGDQIKSKGPNGEVEKANYDGAGRVSAQFTCHDDGETTHAQALDVGSDTVIDQLVWGYDAVGNVIQTTDYRRAPNTTKLGDLSTIWSAVDSRRTFTAQWFDIAHRLTSSVDYGTNGGLSFTRPPSAPVPNSSLTISVMQYAYEGGGRQHQIRDNKNRLTQVTFDNLDRVTETIENYSAGSPTETSLATDQRTEAVYDSSGRLSQTISHNPKGTGLGVQAQVTKFAYGTAANIFRNDLLVAEIYPDSDDVPSPLGNGPDGAYNRVEYGYDYASRRTTIKSQRGTVRTINYDTVGRFASEAVTTLGGVDAAVRRKQLGYDSLSRVQLATSYSAASGGTVVNQIKYTYDGWGNSIKREQSHVGSVVTGTPSFQVAYADGGTVGKYLRPISLTYPNGTVVYVNYQGDTTTGGKLSRIDNFSSVQNDPHSGTTTPYAVFNYLGSDDVMDITHPRITSLGTNGLVHRVGSDGNPAAWDVLDRVTDTRWANTALTTNLDRFTMAYDATGTRVSRKVASTTLPALGSEKDEAYTNDGLDRLTKLNRGLLASGTITDANRKFGQLWTALETLGNWRQMQIAPTGGATYSFTQNRSSNSANEIDVDNNDGNVAAASITGSGGGDWIDPTYDKSGNLRSGPQVGAETVRQWFTYDAWNRLVRVQADNAGAAGATILEYQYDAEDCRTVKLFPSGANWDRTDYFYNFDWQCVEERKNLNVVGKTTVATIGLAQYVWEIRGLDVPVLRFRNADGSANGTLEETLYYCQDANGNTTTLVNASGAVVERYVYDAYGKVIVLDASWNTQLPTVYRNELLFGGYRQDPETLIHLARNRSYHSSLGAWLQRDPAGYMDGGNLYQYVSSSPGNVIDPLGLFGLTGTGEAGVSVDPLGGSAGSTVVAGSGNRIGSKEQEDDYRKAHGMTVAAPYEGAEKALTEWHRKVSRGSRPGMTVVQKPIKIPKRWLDDPDGLTYHRRDGMTVVEYEGRTSRFVRGVFEFILVEAVSGGTAGAFTGPGRTIATKLLPRTLSRGPGRTVAAAGKPAAAARPASRAGTTVAQNKTAGDTFRDQVADAIRQKSRPGTTVTTEKYFWTPLGKRYIDIHVKVPGKPAEGIETKLGKSRYTRMQKLKDFWLKLQYGYKVTLLRGR